MRLHKKFSYSFTFALVVFFLSMIFTFIPCKTAPVVPNPQYVWKLCNLNPDSKTVLGITTRYFGFTDSITYSYIAIIVICFVLAFLVLHFVPYKKN